jgi:hypothetical protein
MVNGEAEDLAANLAGGDRWESPYTVKAIFSPHILSKN